MLTLLLIPRTDQSLHFLTLSWAVLCKLLVNDSQVFTSLEKVSCVPFIVVNGIKTVLFVLTVSPSLHQFNRMFRVTCIRLETAALYLPTRLLLYLLVLNPKLLSLFMRLSTVRYYIYNNNDGTLP